MMKSVGVITLGCDKNRVDTENMLYYLARGGYDLTNDYESAQILIVNTCAFIASARKEGIETILSAARYKEEGQCEKLIVTGCLPQKHREELACGLPEVDAFLGTDEYASICSVIRSLYGAGEEAARCESGALSRLVTTPQHYAYLKIAEGCDNFCTFCTIPSIRGKYRSRSEADLLCEAEALSRQGVKELILVAQDVTRYGLDTGSSLVALLKKLSTLSFATIRLMYCYPELVTNELIEEIASNPKIAKYIDIPIQHIDDTVLKRMNRRSTSEQIQTLFSALAARGIAVRTTLMVGFPQETEEAFERLCDFVRTYKPYHIGVFAYSREEGTPAYKLKGQIPAALKRKRVNAIGALHLKNREETAKSLIGKTLTVLYEDVDYERNAFVGRTQYDAPEIDTKVYFTADFVDVGEYYPVKITGVDGYDLIGEKVE